jgi:hypothetical protein
VRSFSAGKWVLEDQLRNTITVGDNNYYSDGLSNYSVRHKTVFHHHLKNPCRILHFLNRNIPYKKEEKNAGYVPMKTLLLNYN